MTVLICSPAKYATIKYSFAYGNAIAIAMLLLRYEMKNGGIKYTIVSGFVNTCGVVMMTLSTTSFIFASDMWWIFLMGSTSNESDIKAN